MWVKFFVPHYRGIDFIRGNEKIDWIRVCKKKRNEWHNQRTETRAYQKTIARVEVTDSCPDFEGRFASGFRPKLYGFNYFLR